MIKKKIALSLAVILLYQTVHPLMVFALTSGPTQPEFSSFEPIGNTEMVDLFTGDFNYNIPLLNVPGEHGGYPINLFYNSPTSIEQEATMVGLGWNLGIGAINREVRGVPDDFNGVPVSRKVSSKPEVEIAVGTGILLEVFGKKLGIENTLPGNLKAIWNSYDGVGFSYGIQPKIGNDMVSGTLGLNFNSFRGLSYSATIGAKIKNSEKAGGFSLGLSGNHLDGLYNLNIGAVGSLNYSMNDRSSFISFPTLEYVGVSYDITTPFGGEIFGIFPSAPIDIKLSINGLKHFNKRQNYPAYGHMYSHNVQNGNSIMDFTRIKDKPIIENTPNLAIAVNDEDVYTISGHGTGGNFCFSRSDNSNFEDKSSKSQTLGVSFHLETGVGAINETGIDVSIPIGFTLNAASKANSAIESMSLGDNSILEFGHFRKKNELTGSIIASQEITHPFSEDFSYLFRNDLVSPQLSNKVFGRKTTLTGRSLNYKNKFVPFVNDDELPNHQRVRRARSNVITGLSANDISEANFPWSFSRKKVWDKGIYAHPSLPDSGDEINTFIETQPNGQKYIYAVPVYNLEKYEVVATCESENNDADETLKDLKISSNGELDHEINLPGSKDLYDEKYTPKYVQSYLLSYILGDDYIDSNPNDGEPNDTDRGYWVKFEYEKADDYQWRFPYSGGHFNAGYHSYADDNTISFSYGKREQYYPVKIETNSHFAEFNYVDREDGFGVSKMLQRFSDAKGSAQKRLEKIDLFAKVEADENDQSDDSNKTKIKTVNFQYYAEGLGSNFPNAINGKLALEKVSITNYESNRGASNPYHFKYYDSNIEYKHNQSDRWGCYKPAVDNQNFYSPYTLQDDSDDSDEPDVNDYIKAFHLKSIQLPSGANIEVTVERDHYAHVQDNLATQMIEIAGIGALGQSEITLDSDESLEIFFEVGDNITTENVGAYIEDLYEENFNGKAQKQILFKIYSNIMDPAVYTREYVMGAAYLDSNHEMIVTEDEGVKYSSIKLLPFNEELDMKTSSDFNFHPFVVSAWQFLKINMRKLLQPNADLVYSHPTEEEEIISFALQNAKRVFSYLNIFQSFYKTCYNNNRGSIIDLHKSFIRLNNPIKKQYGGNVRVSKVAMKDIWDREDTQPYGNEYIYTKDHVQADGTTIEISTGVAQNEPSIGKEENAFFYMKNFVQDIKWSSDNLYSELHPFNDGSLPGPQVGYSMVKVRSLASKEFEGGDSFSTSGEAVHEFYTAKDFPVILENTKVDQALAKPKWIPLPFGSIYNQFYTGAQGYLCESNNMHGQVKKVSYYSQNKNGDFSRTPVSSVEYQFKFKEESYNRGSKVKKRKRLVNEGIPLLLDLESNMIVEGELGVERTLNQDTRHVESENLEPGISANVNTIFSVLPMPIPTVLPITNYSSSITQTGVMSKTIERQGILDKVIAFDGQSKVETRNLIYDPITGQAVQTSVTNEFDQPIYNTNLSAYHIYDRMGPAYKNEGYTLELNSQDFPDNNIFIYDECTDLMTFQFDSSNPLPFISGDQLIIKQTTSDGISFLRSKFHSKQSNINGIDLYYFDFVDSFDADPGANYSFKILQSGNNNRLADVAQSVSALAEPLFVKSTDGNEPDVIFDEALQASATTYNDFWNFNDENDFETDISSLNYSDVFEGGMNLFKVENTFQYQLKGQSRINTDVNKKGILPEAIHLFDWRNSFQNPNWLSGQKITKYTTSGQVSETKNPLNIYNGRLFTSLAKQNISKPSYLTPTGSKSSILASLGNSRYYESCFSSFEVYEFPYLGSPDYGYDNVGDKEMEIFNHLDLTGHDDEVLVSELYTNVIGVGSESESGAATRQFIIDKPFNGFERFVGGRADIYIPNGFGSDYRSFTVDILAEESADEGLATLISYDDSDECIPEIDFFNVQAHVIISQVSPVCGYKCMQDSPLPICRGAGPCPEGSVALDPIVSHTGNQSLSIAASQSFRIDNFSLDIYPEKKYFASCWIYVDDPMLNNLGGIGASVSVDGNLLLPYGNRINGWQQFRTEFTKELVTNTSGNVLNKTTAIDFVASSDYAHTYFDDFRITPYESQMESYVYDPETHLLKFVLDDNNYYSKYIYDGEGNLISIQKETERGVKSLQENRFYLAESDDINGISSCIEETCSAFQVNVTSSIDPVCEGESAILTAIPSSPSYFLWSTGETTPIINVDANNESGLNVNSYEVTVTDIVSNCEAVGYVSFQLTPLPVIYHVDQIINECGQSVLIIQYEGNGIDVEFHINGVSYIGSGNDNTIEIILPDGTNELTYNWLGDLDCQGSLGIFTPEAGNSISVEILAENFCSGDNTTLTANVTNGSGDILYGWSGGEQGMEISISHETEIIETINYQVIVSDEMGCSSTASVDLTVYPMLSGTATVLDADCDPGTGQIEINFGDFASGEIQISLDNGISFEPEIYNLADGNVILTLDPGNYVIWAQWAESPHCPIPLNLNLDIAPAPCCDVFTCSLSSTPETCGIDGTITVELIGGVGPFEYNWSNGETGEMLTDLVAGTYDLTVTDANSCTSICSGVVEDNFLELTVTVEDQTACDGDLATLTAEADGVGLSFTWSNGATTQSLNVGPGSYTVTVVDVNGCEGVASGTVITAEMPSISCVGENDLCGTGMSSASVETNPNCSDCSYLWSNGETTAEITGIPTGLYSVTVTTSEGCMDECEISIESAEPLVISCDGQNGSCPPNQLASVITTTDGGTEPYNYEWSNGSTGANLLDVPAGSYTVTVIDANGCTATCSSTVHEYQTMSLQCSYTISGCTAYLQTNPSGGVPNYIYNWGNGNMQSDSYSTTVGGVYTATVTDAEGCEVNCTITVPDISPVVVIELTENCPDETYDLTAIATSGNPNYTYLWNTNETTQTITVVDGNYSITVTDQAGCTDVAEILLNGPAGCCPDENCAPFINANNEECTITWGDNESCTTYNCELQFREIGETTWTVYSTVSGTTEIDLDGEWRVSCNSTDVDCDPIESEVVLSDSCLCECEVTIEVDGCNLTAVPANCAGALSYSWTGPGFTSTDPSIHVFENGTYTVVITDANGCQSEPISYTATNCECDCSENNISFSDANGGALDEDPQCQNHFEIGDCSCTPTTVEVLVNGLGPNCGIIQVDFQLTHSAWGNSIDLIDFDENGFVLETGCNSGGNIPGATCSPTNAIGLVTITFCDGSTHSAYFFKPVC